MQNNASGLTNLLFLAIAEVPQYPQFVEQRRKHMDLQLADILHMSLGIVGELGELVQAICKEDLSNLEEEVGDCYFYIVGLRNILMLEYPAELLPAPSPTLHQLGAEIDALVAATDLLDTVKKLWVYEKALSVESIATALETVEFFLIQTLFDFFGQDFKLAEILRGNIAKLEKRYPSGYTNSAAQARVDKAPGE